MQKNVAGQKIVVTAFDSTTGAGKTGDAANITVYVSKDGGAPAALTDTSAAELDATNAPGSYVVDVAQAESNADMLLFTGKSATANIKIDPVLVFTRPPAFNTSVAQTGDNFARLGAPTGASISADVAEVKTQTAAIETDTQDIQSRLPAALSGGRIDATVGAMQANVMTAAASAADLTTELQSGLATAASIAALNNISQADVRTAVGLASANLDTQLTAIDDFLDTEIAAIKAKTDNLPTDPADASDVAASFSTVNTTLATIAGYLDTEIAAIKAKTDNLPTDPADASDVAAAITAALTTAITEAYAADNADASVAQLLYEIRGLLSEFSISGTTLTLKKKDGTTQAATYSLDSSTAPTSITRAS